MKRLGNFQCKKGRDPVEWFEDSVVISRLWELITAHSLLWNKNLSVFRLANVIYRWCSNGTRFGKSIFCSCHLTSSKLQSPAPVYDQMWKLHPHQCLIHVTQNLYPIMFFCSVFYHIHLPSSVCSPPRYHHHRTHVRIRIQNSLTRGI